MGNFKKLFLLAAVLILVAGQASCIVRKEPPLAGVFDIENDEYLSIQTEMIGRSSALAVAPGGGFKKLTDLPGADYIFQTDYNYGNIYIAAARSNGLLQISKQKEWKYIDLSHVSDNFAGYTAVVSMPDGGAIVTRNSLGYKLPNGRYANLAVRLSAAGEVMWSQEIGIYTDSITVDNGHVLISGSDKNAGYYLLDLADGKVQSENVNIGSLNSLSSCQIQETNIVCIAIRLENGARKTKLITCSLPDETCRPVDGVMYTGGWQRRLIEDSAVMADNDEFTIYNSDGSVKVKKNLLPAGEGRVIAAQPLLEGTTLLLSRWNTSPSRANGVVKDAEEIIEFDTKKGTLRSLSFDLPQEEYLGYGGIIPGSWFNH